MDVHALQVVMHFHQLLHVRYNFAQGVEALVLKQLPRCIAHELEDIARDRLASAHFPICELPKGMQASFNRAGVVWAPHLNAAEPECLFEVFRKLLVGVDASNRAYAILAWRNSRTQRNCRKEGQ